jgi:hypothetical protein
MFIGYQGGGGGGGGGGACYAFQKGNIYTHISIDVCHICMKT